MNLYLNTAKNSVILVELREAKKVIISKEIEAKHRQAEKLIPLVDSLLKAKKKSLSDIKNIIVENKGEGFTSLRIGVTTANALAYALGAILETPKQGRVKFAKPEYERPPSITLKK
ncbi:MAG: hypothetical protein NTY12_03220 [Candidatus Falkowbacteria bacterium]|nr:hypothetical protein [Candidatus Falkowbacteria bacterium]